MNSDFENYTLTYDWLPCISCGWSDMTYHDQKGFGAGAKDIFGVS